MNKSAIPINGLRIEPQSGVGFSIKQGQTIRVIDVKGEQVADLFCFAEEEIKEFLSIGQR